MTKSRLPALAVLPILAALGSGCDSEAPTSAEDYRTAAHVDLAVATTAPWVKAALKDQVFDIDGDLGPCLKVLTAAESVTLGTSDKGYEVYFSGPMNADAADGCTEFLEKSAKKSKKKDGEQPEGVLLDGDLFAVHSRKLSPTRARLETLLTADPSPGGNPLWLVAQPEAKDGKAPVEFVQLWGDTAKGLALHADVQFANAAKATELYGKAMLGLTAMRMSGETEELARSVKLGSHGDTITADIKLPAATLTKMIAAKKASVKVKAHSGGKDKEKENSISISIGAEK